MKPGRGGGGGGGGGGGKQGGLYSHSLLPHHSGKLPRQQLTVTNTMCGQCAEQRA